MDQIIELAIQLIKLVPLRYRKYGKEIFGNDRCYQKLVLDLKFNDKKLVDQCLSELKMSVLESGLMFGSGISKLPIINNLIKNGRKQSMKVSVIQLLLETMSYMILLGYQVRVLKVWNFGAFGELAVLVVQNMVVMTLVLMYRRRLGYLVALAAVTVLVGYFLFSQLGMVSRKLARLALFATPLFASSKLFGRKSNYLMSAAEVVLSAVRLVLNWDALRDNVLLIFSACSLVLNVGLIWWASRDWGKGTKRGKRKVR